MEGIVHINFTHSFNRDATPSTWLVWFFNGGWWSVNKAKEMVWITRNLTISLFYSFLLHLLKLCLKYIQIPLLRKFYWIKNHNAWRLHSTRKVILYKRTTMTKTNDHHGWETVQKPSRLNHPWHQSFGFFFFACFCWGGYPRGINPTGLVLRGACMTHTHVP